MLEGCATARAQRIRKMVPPTWPFAVNAGPSSPLGSSSTKRALAGPSSSLTMLLSATKVRPSTVKRSALLLVGD